MATMIDGIEAGPCCVCGALTTVRCDHGDLWQAHDQGCDRWLCWNHATVEAQLGDTRGADGVDIRCSGHTAPPGTVEIM